MPTPGQSCELTTLTKYSLLKHQKCLIAFWSFLSLWVREVIMTKAQPDPFHLNCIDLVPKLFIKRMETLSCVIIYEIIHNRNFVSNIKLERIFNEIFQQTIKPDDKWYTYYNQNMVYIQFFAEMKLCWLNFEGQEDIKLHFSSFPSWFPALLEIRNKVSIEKTILKKQIRCGSLY